jgi:pimeloyl-ACP methyl ester carboxylesterase
MRLPKFGLVLCLATLSVFGQAFAETGSGEVIKAHPVISSRKGESGAIAVRQQPVTPIKLTEYVPLKVKNKGPAEAKGVIYFVNGLDSDNRTRDDYLATYPYVYGLNTHSGWDVIAAKFPNSERYSLNSIPGSAMYLMQRVDELHAQGYKRVIVAGQSWGAWITVAAAKQNGAEKHIDALLLTAPANYGTRTWHGRPNDYFVLNKTEYEQNIKTIRVPTAAIFFKDDEFDPGGRGPVTRDTFAANHVAAMVIDQPPGFTGHGGGWMPQFDYIYGGCIDAFLERPRTMQCKTSATPSNTDSRSVATERDALDGGARLVSLSELNNKTFIVTGAYGQVTVEQYSLSMATVMDDDSIFHEEMRNDGDRICFINTCSRIYQLKDGGFVGFGSDGRLTARMVEAN